MAVETYPIGSTLRRRDFGLCLYRMIRELKGAQPDMYLATAERCCRYAPHGASPGPKYLCNLRAASWLIWDGLAKNEAGPDQCPSFSDFRWGSAGGE